MTVKHDPILIGLVRKTSPTTLADILCSVQPIPSDCLTPLLAGAMSEAELVAEGYEPVSNIKMVWMKKR